MGTFRATEAQLPSQGMNFHLSQHGSLSQFLPQFLHEPRQDHWDVALRVVRYLKGSPDQRIFF